MSAIEITGLNVHYGKVHAVRDVDLYVDQGEVVVVVGPNGAGKSSLLAALSGLVPPSSGRVVMSGTDITGRPAHRIARLGLVQVPEGRRIFAPLTIDENLKLGAYTVKDRARVKELRGTVLEMFPILADRIDSPAGLLSGGEQQMLAFGRALMSDPHTMLLDEPSMGLSPALVDRVIEAIRQISESGLSILMVEQNASAAFGVANRAYILDQGEISLEGPVGEVAADPRVLAAFLGVTEED
ncbi:MAG: transporter ATP-binding protein [Subtercola sp.]|nr:transporter ATP-binding protein [Subtercola sp.]